MQNVNLTLTVQEVNAVLAALGNMPYAQVFELVQKVASQAQPQVQAQPVTEEQTNGD